MIVIGKKVKWGVKKITEVGESKCVCLMLLSRLQVFVMNVAVDILFDVPFL